MYGQSPHEVAQFIQELVRENAPILGSKVSTDVRSKFPGWGPQLHGATSLRQFIEVYVPSVSVFARPGKDVIYNIADTSVVEHREINLWRIWVSPNSPFVLVLNSDFELSAAKRGSPQTGLVLTPPPAEIHRDIAKAFADQNGLAAHLDYLLDRGPEGAQEWSRLLRSSGKWSDWTEFRRSALETVLKHELLRAGIPEHIATHLADEVVRSRGHHASISSETVSLELLSARAAAIEIINRMNLSELRALKLPFGIVLDTLSRVKR
jgi:hypothetical protein